MWKRCGIIFLGFLTSVILAAENAPGQKLFSFVEQVLTQAYVNPREQNIASIVKQGQEKLDRLCQKISDCTFENAKRIVQSTLNVFGDAHLKFNATDLDNSDLGDPGSRFGFYVRYDELQCVVTYVYPESPAEKAGIQVGMKIVKVDNQTASPQSIVQRLREKEVSLSEAVIEVIKNGQERRFKIRATDTRGYIPVHYSVQTGIQVIRLLEAARFQEQLFHNIIKQIKSTTKAIIIDLRDNSGGTSITSMNIAAAFFDKPGRIMVQKDGVRWILEFNGLGIAWRNADDADQKGEFDGDLQETSKFVGKVAALTSKTTVSAGEQLAHLLQSSGVARVFGEVTAGGLDTSVDFKYYNEGGFLMYGTNRYQDLNGVWLPPRVTPDEIVPLDLDLLTQGRDTQLEAALKYLGQ